MPEPANKAAEQAAKQAAEKPLKTAGKVVLVTQRKVHPLIGKSYTVKTKSLAKDISSIDRNKAIRDSWFSSQILAERVGVDLNKGIQRIDQRESSVKAADLADVEANALDVVKDILDHHTNTLEGSQVKLKGPDDAGIKKLDLIEHPSSSKSPAMITTKRQDHHAGYQAVNVNPANLPGNQKSPTEVRSSHSRGAGFMEGAAIRCFELGLEADIKSHQWARQGGGPSHRVDQVNLHLNKLSTASANILKADTKIDMGSRMAKTITEYKCQDVKGSFGYTSANPGVARAMVLAASTHPKAATALLDKISSKGDDLGPKTRQSIKEAFRKSILSQNINLKGFEQVSGKDMAGKEATTQKNDGPLQISTGATADLNSKNVNNLFNEKTLSNRDMTKNISATAFKANTNNVLLDGMIEKVLGIKADGQPQSQKEQIAAFNDTIHGLNLNLSESQQLLSIVQSVGGMQDISIDKSKQQSGTFEVGVAKPETTETTPALETPKSTPQRDAAETPVAPVELEETVKNNLEASEQAQPPTSQPGPALASAKEQEHDTNDTPSRRSSLAG